MYASKFNTRTLGGLALAAALTLMACSDHIDPTAPRSESQPPLGSRLGLNLTPPELSAEMQATLGNPEEHGALRSSSASNANFAASSSFAASASTQSLQVNGGGMACNGNQVVVFAPQPRGTPVGQFVQSVPPQEWAWWYPVLYRWQGGQWERLENQFGWAYTQLHSANRQWIAYTNRRAISQQVSPPMTPHNPYYAVVSWVYFGNSQRWVSEVERKSLAFSVNGNPQPVTYWCQLYRG